MYCTARSPRWNRLNRHYLEWLAAHPEQGIAVRGEDLMGPDDAKAQYERIGRHFNLEAREAGTMHVFLRRVNNLQRLDKPMDFAYFRDHQYLTAYDADSLPMVSKAVDPWILEQLHYERLA